MKKSLRRISGIFTGNLLVLGLLGCASNKHEQTLAQTQFVAGQEEAFAQLQLSGIYVVRVVGPFKRTVLLWHKGMTLAETILEAGYLEEVAPTQFLIQRGPTALTVTPDSLLRGKDVPVEAGDVIRVIP